MKLQINTIHCRELHKHLHTGCITINKVRCDIRQTLLRMQMQTCPEQVRLLRQAEQELAALEEELAFLASSLFQIAGIYEAYEQAVQSLLQQLPSDTLFRPSDVKSASQQSFIKRTQSVRLPELPQSIWAVINRIRPLPERSFPLPRLYRLPEVPVQLQNVLMFRIVPPDTSRLARLPVSLFPIRFLALTDDTVPQPWLTDAVLYHLQAQNDFSQVEE